MLLYNHLSFCRIKIQHMLLESLLKVWWSWNQDVIWVCCSHLALWLLFHNHRLLAECISFSHFPHGSFHLQVSNSGSFLHFESLWPPFLPQLTDFFFCLLVFPLRVHLHNPGQSPVLKPVDKEPSYIFKAFVII